MIVVRPARAEEVAELAAIGLAAWCHGIKPLVGAEVARRIERTNPFLAFLRQMGAGVLVADWDGKASGIGASERADDQISDIWIAPAAQGRGLASALVGALERQIGERGYVEAHIQVAAANTRAHSLYRHLGYEPRWRRTAFDPLLQTTLVKVGLTKRL